MYHSDLRNIDTLVLVLSTLIEIRCRERCVGRHVLSIKKKLSM